MLIIFRSFIKKRFKSFQPEYYSLPGSSCFRNILYAITPGEYEDFASET